MGNKNCLYRGLDNKDYNASFLAGVDKITQNPTRGTLSLCCSMLLSCTTDFLAKAFMDSSVVLINVFSVPQGVESEFLDKWYQIAELMKNEPGFIETKLHRSLDPTARFQFINIAKWSSQSTWQTAFSKHVSQQEIFEQQLLIEANPALYQVEAKY